ncbi:hypothetical protein WDZ92_39515 [Nostoc sp. NIES-2111]
MTSSAGPDSGGGCYIHEAGDTPIDRMCQRTDKTLQWAAVGDAYDATNERIQVRR